MMDAPAQRVATNTMNTDSKLKLFTAPNGERISPTLNNRIAAAKPILEQANAERLTRSDAAGRIVFDGMAVSEATAYTYVRLLGIQWNHRQDYRRRVDREKLRRVVPLLLAQGLTLGVIAGKVGCSVSTVNRFVREAGLIEDGKRYVAPTAKYGRRKKEAVK